MEKWEKWKQKVSRWKFDKKMQALVTVSIIATTLVVLIISTVFSVTSMKSKSVELLQARNDTLAENYRSTLEEYKALAIAMVLNGSVQSYLECNDKRTPRYQAAAEGTYNVMASSENMHPDMNFIAVVSYQKNDYLYRGKYPVVVADFQRVYKQDYQKCKNAHKSSTIKMGVSNAYFKGEKYTMNVYFPAYNLENIMAENGLVCMNFSVPVLEQIFEEDADSAQRTAVVDTDDRIVAMGDENLLGKTVSYTEQLQGESGSFTKNGRLYIYQKVTDWNYYIVSSIEIMELYKPSILTAIWMLGAVVLLIIISYMILQRVVRKVYSPMDKVIQKMDDVTSGTLTTRIDVDNMGEDFVKLAAGFNQMMEEIQVLMEQVKQEQHQIEQIRFNSLQSQIQPHFLYNTLDCIHWQAVADGNQEVSTLVKALARYYRICLSKGHDVIPLGMEIEHVKNYLIIQNMRYDNIIGSELQIQPGCEEVMIPKLTLQPLVENSIYHGIKVKEGKTGSISLTAERKGDMIRIVLVDTGTGMSWEQINEMNQHLSEYDEGFGYGVRNVNKRIELLYGQAYGLHYLANDFGGVTVEIRLPYETEIKRGTMQGDIINV